MVLGMGQEEKQVTFCVSLIPNEGLRLKLQQLSNEYKESGAGKSLMFFHSKSLKSFQLANGSWSSSILPELQTKIKLQCVSQTQSKGTPGRQTSDFTLDHTALGALKVGRFLT